VAFAGCAETKHVFLIVTIRVVVGIGAAVEYGCGFKDL